MLSKKIKLPVSLVRFNGVPIDGKSIYNKVINQTSIDKNTGLKPKPQFMQSVSTSLINSYIYDLSGRRIQTTKKIKNGLYIINKDKQSKLLLNLGSYR